MIEVPGYEMGGILFHEDQIKNRVKELGRQISEDYRGKKLLAVGILKGSFIFMADLVRAIEGDVEVDFMSVSSYGNQMESSGRIRVRKDMDASPEKQHILLIEDIIDTGNTLKYLKETYLADKGAASVKLAALLDKPSRRTADITPDYTGFEVDDLFIVGYGLDYAQQFRQLPHIAYLRSTAE